MILLLICMTSNHSESGAKPHNCRVSVYKMMANFLLLWSSLSEEWDGVRGAVGRGLCDVMCDGRMSWVRREDGPREPKIEISSCRAGREGTPCG